VPVEAQAYRNPQEISTPLGGAFIVFVAAACRPERFGGAFKYSLTKKIAGK